MASKFSSGFDELLDRGRREFDELAGKPVAAPESPRAVPGQTAPRSAATTGSVVEGTVSGIPFRLKANW